ncbi:hypothetical protein [Candidatus Roseilinea sp. NK_OTU-006]|jgi:hypothetical protein|nr:hypothetical protein [Candidatus Roseilinea sp. NK_OTU-006]
MSDALIALACQRYIRADEQIAGRPFVPGAYPVNERILRGMEDCEGRWGS